ncbi:MAG: MFS transporter [Cohaesibacteraceae bacterium]
MAHQPSDSLSSSQSVPSKSSGWAMATLSLCMLLAALGISIVAIALPALVEVFDTTLAGAQWVILAYLLTLTVSTLPLSRLADGIGLRPVLLGGLVLFVVASLVCSLAPNLGFLIGGRAAQGMGAAILMALPLSVVRQTVPAERTGAAMGLLGTMSAIGTALGPSLGGWLISLLGWSSVFLAMALIGGVAFFLALMTVPPQAKGAQPNKTSRLRDLDIAGLVTLVALLSAYALALTANGGAFTLVHAGLLVAAVAGAFLFVRIERSARQPLIAIALFKDWHLGSGVVMNLLVSAVMMATLIVGPFFLKVSLGLSDALVGLVMAIGPATAALSGVPAGLLTDRLNAQTVVRIGLGEMTVATLLLAFLPVWLGVPGFLIALVFLTPGYQLFLAALNAGQMMRAGAEHRGAVAGLLRLSRNLGFITGASLLGAVFAWASGDQNPIDAGSEAVAIGMTVTYLVCCGLVLMALLLSSLGQQKEPVGEARGTHKEGT